MVNVSKDLQQFSFQVELQVIVNTSTVPANNSPDKGFYIILCFLTNILTDNKRHSIFQKHLMHQIISLHMLNITCINYNPPHAFSTFVVDLDS